MRRQSGKHYVLYVVASLSAVVAVVAAVLAHAIFQPDTVITQTSSVTRHIAPEDGQAQHVAKDVFTVDLPEDWVAATPPAVPFTAYSWRGKAGSKDETRRLDVYIDKLPTSLAVNRLLPVRANQSNLDVLGAVSDNCVNFTDKTVASTQTGYAASTWKGVSFLCDVGNYERNVVATGSEEGINVVTPSGETTGRHHVLLLYTDNSVSPDYTLFLAIVRSFHLI